MPVDLKHKTISDFGEQWLAYQENPKYYGSVDMLIDIVGPMMSIDEISGMRVADIGSGTGRIVNMLLDAGAAHVIAVEPSDAMPVLKANTAKRSDRVDYLKITGERLPDGLDLDLIFSIGVIHHIPDPGPVIDAAFRALRPGGRLLIWIYGYEGNETYLRLSEPLRSITTRLPHRVLDSLSWGLACVLSMYIAICRYFPLPMHLYMRNVLKRIPFSVRKLTIYDQLNPTYSKYYKRQEALSLLENAGFQSVDAYHRHAYSWAVLGSRPNRQDRAAPMSSPQRSI